MTLQSKGSFTPEMHYPPARVKPNQAQERSFIEQLRVSVVFHFDVLVLDFQAERRQAFLTEIPRGGSSGVISRY